VHQHQEAIMELDRGSDTTGGRVLVVADWTIDPEAVVAACIERRELSGGKFGVLVPARLHGLDWVGDPSASIPCAYRQLATLAHLADSVGIAFEAAGVGDADPVAAVCDALDGWPADELLLCTRARRAAVSHPLDLAHRVGRAAGLPVSLVRVGAATARRRNPWLPRRTGHCALHQPHPA
jgi:hypothetical protein